MRRRPHAWAFTSRGRRPGPTAWSPVSIRICGRLPATTAAPTDDATASPASFEARTGVLVASKGGNAILSMTRGELTWPTSSMMEKITKTYRGVPAVKDVDFTLRQWRDPCAAGRERRRQVDADQDHGRSRPGHHRPDVLQGAGGQLRLALGGACGGHRHGVPGDQPRPLHDGGAEPLSRHGEVPQPAARHLHRGAAIPAVAELHRRSDGDRSARSAPPSGRWSRSPAPCITRPRSSSSTSRPPR